MAGATGFANIEKLTGQNYELWKVQMKSVLVFNDLWPYVEGTEVKPQENAQGWTNKDAKALALINLSITHGQLSHVKKATSSKEAWDGLKTVFESRGPVRKAALYKQMQRMEKKPDISMTQYVTDFVNKAEQLAEAGIEIPDELLSIMLLGSLPTEFENFCVAIESRDAIPTLECLKVKLIEEEARQSDRSAKTESYVNNSDALLTKSRFNRSKQTYGNSNYSDTKVKSSKFMGKCFNCGKNGHISRNCKLKSRRSESSAVSDAMTAIACNTELSKKSRTWYLDSGATRHMCNDKRIFENMHDNEQLKVFTAAEHFVESIGAGDIKLDAKVKKNAINSVKLKNAMYVPDLRNNLVSVSNVTNNGYTVTFKKDRATINRLDGSIALTATKRDNLYIVDEKRECVALADEKGDVDLLKWHQRYGHLNINDLKKMKNQGMVSGMTFESKMSEIICEVCAKCKIHVQPFKRSTTREKEVLSLVHSDICGPINTESLGGAKYFVTFIDDYSRYTEVIMLRNRSDVLEAFKNYKSRVENLTGKRIKKLRTDNGREYLSNEFNNFLKEKGISRQLSVEYTPQQNGIAERANRTLVEMARCIMLQADLPKSLWAEAVNTAAYLRNRCATKCLGGITPLEAWSQQKPYVGFFRTIGSKTIVLNKGPRKGKFQPKGEEYILVGYSEESKAYRLWKPGTRTVIKARDVKFIEKINCQQLREIFTAPISLLDTLNKSHEERNEKVIEDNLEKDIENVDEPEIENSAEDDLSDSSEEDCEINKQNRGSGRPSFIRTGKPGRPRKVYQMKNNLRTDPSSASEIYGRNDEKS